MNRRQNIKESQTSALVVFDPFVSKYRFCFSLLPSSVGCYVAAIAEFSFLFAVFAYQYVVYYFQNSNAHVAEITPPDYKGKTLNWKNYTTKEEFAAAIGNQKSPALLIVLGLAMILTLIFIVCLLVGVHRDNDKLVFAHLVFQCKEVLREKLLLIMDPLINKDSSTSDSFKEQSLTEAFLSKTKIKKGSKKQDNKNDESQPKKRTQSTKEQPALIWKRAKFATMRMKSGGSGSSTMRSMDSGGSTTRRGGSGKATVFGTVLSAVSMKRKAQLDRTKSSASLTDRLSTAYSEKQYCNMEDSPIYILRTQQFLYYLEHNINVINSLTGDTPLHWAVEKNCLKSVQHLLTKPDLDTTILNKKGYAPIHLAVVLNKQAILERWPMDEKD
uniref:Uncharacterized protein n=1 Tax=Romanomermis culicivorax TaxID=13658 RepID=A0A915IXV1_ROMCU